MTYIKREKIITPSDDTKVLRYMDLYKFLSLLINHKIYFSSIDELQNLDPREGDTPQLFGNMKERIKKTGYDQLAPHIKINCWFNGDCSSTEAQQMWMCYGDAVAISTTIGELKDAFRDRDIWIGNVDYRSIDNDNDFNIDPNDPEYFFVKSENYRNEREVRVMLCPSVNVNSKIFQDSEGSRAIVCKDEGDEGVSGGELVDVNLTKLINVVFLSPNIQEWQATVIENVIRKYELNVEISRVMASA